MWRNWQTRWSQEPVLRCGGSSPLIRTNDVSVRTNRTEKIQNQSEMVDFFVQFMRCKIVKHKILAFYFNQWNKKITQAPERLESAHLRYIIPIQSYMLQHKTHQSQSICFHEGWQIYQLFHILFRRNFRENSDIPEHLVFETKNSYLPMSELFHCEQFLISLLSNLITTQSKLIWNRTMQ